MSAIWATTMQTGECAIDVDTVVKYTPVSKGLNVTYPSALGEHRTHHRPRKLAVGSYAGYAKRVLIRGVVYPSTKGIVILQSGMWPGCLLHPKSIPVPLLQR